ncbi:MAG: hypothetical protein J3K34DRAFT_525651 [Monoraphidium minutum]|nr:MAG: hypothetical protein J3K34DRAFT_525651 [Monoraphidium minutum]
MEVWRPAHVAQSTIGCLVSNPGGSHIDAVYTFGHSHDPQKTAEQDNKAAAWWGSGARPSTQDAASKDIEEFWSEARRDPSASLTRVTGRDTAAAVKAAGRGSHVTLGFLGNEFTRSSKYRYDFCEGGAAGAAAAGGPAAQYAAATRAARANRALGTGASLSLAQMW